MATNFEHNKSIIMELVVDNLAVRKDGTASLCGDIPCGVCVFYHDGRCCDREKREAYWNDEYNVRHFLTLEEKHIIFALPDGYLVRNQEGKLWCGNIKPTKDDGLWIAEGGVSFPLEKQDIFEFITFDSEPQRVSDLRKMEVIEYGN